MAKENVILNKSYDFALRIVKAYKYLTEEKKEFILSKQLLRSGTAIGALVREAEHAQSPPDFFNKMNVALKEANETEYWISLLKDSDYLDLNMYNSIQKDCSEIIKILIGIVRSIKETLKK